MTQVELDRLRALEIAGNIASIRKVPQRLLSDDRRQGLIARAANGDDLYCYSTIGHWNLWADGKRIELGEYQEGDEA